MRNQALPPPNFDHLNRLTDDTGILQHAKYDVPNRVHGYCVDDNARALLVVILGREILPHQSYCRLASTYLSFLLHAYNKDRDRFRNFLSYERSWLDEVGSEDCHGRAIWSLGILSAGEPNGFGTSLASELFCQSLNALNGFHSPRSLAFSILGIDTYLASNDNGICYRTFRRIADRLKKQYMENAIDNWPWVEDIVTYDNGRISQALILAGQRLNDPEMRLAGLRSLEWLMKVQTDQIRNCFVPIGNRGWFSKSSAKALFDQQPLEAAAMIDACLCAFDLTKDNHWYTYAQTCFDWFLGDNTAHYSLYDPLSGGCRDGVEFGGLNENQGAESTLCWLLAFLAFHRRLKPNG